MPKETTSIQPCPADEAPIRANKRRSLPNTPNGRGRLLFRSDGRPHRLCCIVLYSASQSFANPGGVCYVKTFHTAPAPSGFDEFVGPRGVRPSVVCAGTPPWQDFRRLLRSEEHQLRRLQHCGLAKEWRGR